MNLVLLGPPGAGKGTQADLLIEGYSICHVSTGDILRKSVREGTELGKKAKSFMDKGELVPDEVVIGIVRERLNENDCKSGFLLDGFPRTINQAKALQESLRAEGQDLDAVLYMKVDEKELIKRLSGRRTCTACGKVYHIEFSMPESEGVCNDCGGELVLREDDKEESVKRRFEVFIGETEPLINFYKEKDLLREVDGKRPPTEVYQTIKGTLEEIRR